MLSNTEKAEVFRLGLTVGLFDIPEIVSWADEVIAVDDKPSNELIEVSMGGDKNTAGMVELLRLAAGDQAPGKPLDVLLGLVAERVAAGQLSAGSAGAMIGTLKSAYDGKHALLDAASEASKDEGATQAFLAPLAAHAAAWRG